MIIRIKLLGLKKGQKFMDSFCVTGAWCEKECSDRDCTLMWLIEEMIIARVKTGPFRWYVSCDDTREPKRLRRKWGGSVRNTYWHPQYNEYPR